LYGPSSAGTYADLPADANNTVRGIAISPVTTNVLYASRTSSNHVSTVAFAGGAFLGSMQELEFPAALMV